MAVAKQGAANYIVCFAAALTRKLLAKGGMKVTIQLIIGEILLIVLQGVLILAGGFVIGYLKEKLGAQRLNQAYNIVKMVVNSIEQTYGSGDGKTKKEAAAEIIRKLTAGKLNEDQIDRLIESAVFEMNLILKNNGVITGRQQ